MKPIRVVGAIAAAALLLGAGFWLGRNVTGHDDTSRVAAAPEAAVSTPAGRKVLYWHDPMVPQQRFDKPGKSPFMDMPLAPVYADEDAPGGVQVSPSIQQSLGIRTATVRRAGVSSSFDAVGAVQFDERRNVAVQTRVAGYIERLAVRAPMERVRKGQTLATVFAPDWLAPQNELIALKTAGVPADLVAAARDRLRALSIPEDLVQRSEQSGSAQARFALASPADGVVAELAVREGVAVSPGMTLFRIAGLETVWAVAEIPEAQAVRLARGQKVKATLQADPSQAFEGELKEILPEVSSATRTLKARFEVDNKGGKLVPGMLLRLAVAGPQVDRLLVSSEAVIRTGKRAVAILRSADGRFEPREVALGADFGDDVEVVSGLAVGDQVVASGQFLIDSEARLRSVLGNLAVAAEPPSQSPAQLAQAAPAVQVHEGEGRVERVSAEALTISHGAITTLKWPAMTMSFAKPRAGAFADIKQGDRVRFRFREAGASAYELVEVTKLSTGAAK